MHSSHLHDSLTHMRGSRLLCSYVCKAHVRHARLCITHTHTQLTQLTRACLAHTWSASPLQQGCVVMRMLCAAVHLRVPSCLWVCC